MLCPYLGIIINLHLYKDNYFVIYFKIQLSQYLYLSHHQSMSDAHEVECLLNIQVLFRFYRGTFYKGKMNSYGIYFVKKETRKEYFYIYKKMRCTNIN